MSSNSVVQFGFRVIEAGAYILGAGVVASLFWRRRDLALWKVLTAGSYLATDPERHVSPERARLVRSIFVAGLGVVLFGALTAFVAGIKW